MTQIRRITEKWIQDAGCKGDSVSCVTQGESEGYDPVASRTTCLLISPLLND